MLAKDPDFIVIIVEHCAKFGAFITKCTMSLLCRPTMEGHGIRVHPTMELKMES